MRGSMEGERKEEGKNEEKKSKERLDSGKGREVEMKERTERKDIHTEIWRKRKMERNCQCENHLMWSLTTPTTTSRIMKVTMRSITCTRGTRSGQRLCASLYSPNPASTNMYVVSTKLIRRKMELIN